MLDTPSPLHVGAEGFLARFEAMRERLPGDQVQRQEAAEAFRKSGLPGTRDEAWKYTSLLALSDASFNEPPTRADQPAAPLPALVAPRLVFVDGRYQPDQSVPPDLARFTRFADSPRFGHLARPEQEPMAALNAMLAEDGAILTVEPGVDAGTVLLISHASGDEGRPVAFHPRHQVRLAEGAKLTVIEFSGGGRSYLHNPVLEAEIAAGASLTHLRVLRDGEGAYHLATLYAGIAERGTYDGFVLNLGGRIVRTEIHARLSGPRATAHLNGAQLLGGLQHGDITTVVAHDAPNCASRQTVKTVATGRARGVFQGRIEVARAAQKTDGYQMSQALLLSPKAEVDFKPQLEIYADDVKCSHGATVGELDPEQLFYLRSRGVPETEARSILIRAFLSEALDPITHEGARALMEQAIEDWWAEQPA